MATCPNGHPSSATDYCDVCGAPIGGAAAPASATPTAAGAQACPSCETPNASDALFCEACGYDFTTGSMPRPLDPPEALIAPDAPAPAPDAPAPQARAALAPDTAPPAATSTPTATTPPAGDFSWVVEVWIDPAWYAAQESPDSLPSAGAPVVRPLRGRSLLVGRTSVSRNIYPDVDCESDTGVSRRQSQLTTDGSRWWVEDLDSANGTFVGPASGTLPKDPVPVGTKHELKSDDRVYVGAWTRLVIRAATDDERPTLG